MKRLFPVLFALATLPAMAVTPRAQHTCIAMGHFAGQVQMARQNGLPASRVRRQVDAARGKSYEHRLWREIIHTIYQMPIQESSAQVNRSFYDNCMMQASQKRR